jgi:hypothetical protein
VWDAARGADILVLRGHAPVRDGHEPDGVWAAAFSPDGGRIVSGAADGTVRVWDAASGAELLVLRGHESVVSAAAFSPDGARIMSREWGLIRLWFVGRNDAELAAHACASLPRDLSPEAIQRFNLDPEAPWPCAGRAKTLWPHPLEATILPAAGPEKTQAPR